jgi:predicted transcriptional regulator
VSAARAYPLKVEAKVKVEVKFEHAPAKKAVSHLESRNLNQREKEVVKSVRFTVFICLP